MIATVILRLTYIKPPCHYHCCDHAAASCHGTSHGIILPVNKATNHETSIEGEHSGIDDQEVDGNIILLLNITLLLLLLIELLLLLLLEIILILTNIIITTTCIYAYSYYIYIYMYVCMYM